jgi:predicted acetyltransferase
MDIIKPRSEYFEEYLNACQESYDNNIVDWMPFNPKNYEQWKECILELYENYENGINIPENLPRTYTYWCIEENKLIGEIQLRPFLSEAEAKRWGHLAYAVRHSKWNNGYGTKILEKGLEKAREFQIKNVYIACREDNLGSIKVITKNNGGLVDKIISDEGIPNNLYYIGV